MKFGFTPVEYEQVIFKDDDEYFKSLGLNYYQDIKEDLYGDSYRIYSDMLLIPSFAKELFKVGQRSCRLEDGKQTSESEMGEWITIDSKHELEECIYIRLKNGAELYYY